MRNIIVIECTSTGTNFVEDIINRGYNPILLDLKTPDTEEGHKFREYINSQYEKIAYDVEIIYEKDTYEETLEMVREYDPILIVPGNERGVILTTKMSHDLGLLGNPVENLRAMTFKDAMHERLAECGLRSIRGKVVKSVEEAIEFYESEGLEEVVLKPIYSAGSTGVRICANKEEMIDSVKLLFHELNHYGDFIQELLLQERINGEEYIVNTVSHKGVHRVTLIWKYNKIKTAEGAIVYDSCETVNELNLGEAEMVEYAYAVADALGIQYGPVHGEYMIDEKGPVLIEVNCRPCGGGMAAEFLDRISGQHETDSILDSYLKPERFYDELRKKYELYAYGTLKFFIVPTDILPKSSPMVEMSHYLKAYYTTSLVNNFDLDTVYQKTEDLHTSAGTTFLVHEDSAVVERNLNFLRAVERNAFSLVLSEDTPQSLQKDDEKYLNDIMPLIEKSENHGTGLFVSDQVLDETGVFQISPNQLDGTKGKFDFVLVNLNKSLIDKNADEKVSLILNIFSKIRTGGMVFIPKNTYTLMAGGRKGMEALIKVLDYKIELPPFDVRDVIIASKNN